MALHPLGRFNRILFTLGRRLPIEDFDLRALLPDRTEREPIRTKVIAALTLLRSYAPVRYACLRRDLPRLWISATQHIAQCFYDIGLCLIQFDYVLSPQTTPEQVALTLVHEGTHARLLRAGFKYDEAVRARIERLCILTEILVARRLPASDELVAAASRRLARPTEFWSNAAFRARDLEQLAQLGPAARSAERIAGWLARLWRWSRAA